jgi:hypothetical protein
MLDENIMSVLSVLKGHNGVIGSTACTFSKTALSLMRNGHFQFQINDQWFGKKTAFSSRWHARRRVLDGCSRPDLAVNPIRAHWNLPCVVFNPWDNVCQQPAHQIRVQCVQSIH